MFMYGLLDHFQRDHILDITGLDQPVNIFTVDTDRMERRLTDNPWIISAQVAKELPRTIRISVREKERAGWVYFGELYQIDSDGLIIEPGRAAELDSPVITGIEPMSTQDDGGIQAARIRTALNLIHLYRVHGLSRFDELVEIHFDEMLGFTLLTHDYAMEIRIGAGQFVQRLDRLRAVFETLDGEALEGRYILLDGESSLTRVAVGPVRPGRGGRGLDGTTCPHCSDQE